MRPIFAADSLDDLARLALDYVTAQGETVTATKGETLEVRHMQLTLTNPLARVSRTLERGKPFSTLGEFCWYMSGSAAFPAIEPYIQRYRDDAEDGILRGAYGPRLAPFLVPESSASLIEALRAKPSSRQAVVPIAQPSDFRSGQKDVPCTTSLQFFVRGGALELAVTMRSNDLVYGLVHDVFAFTMIQEYVATALQLPMGRYVHSVGSAHIYTKPEIVALVQAFLDAGYTDTRRVMPPMPAGTAEQGLDLLLRHEQALRSGLDPLQVRYGEGYWSDLARILGCHYLVKSGRRVEASNVTAAMSPEFQTWFEVFLLDKTEGRPS